MATTPIQSLLSKLDQCPPFVCYYAAQMGRKRRPTLPELVKSSGMSKRTFSRIAHRTSWNGVTVERMSQFSEACGIDPLDSSPVMMWLAERHKSGMLFRDFEGCRGQGEKMIAAFNSLAAKSVMGKVN